MTADQEKIRQLEARVAELEKSTCCACCTPIVKETSAILAEVRSNWEYPYSNDIRPIPRCFAHVHTPWGELKIQLDDKDVDLACGRMKRRGTLRLELK